MAFSSNDFPRVGSAVSRKPASELTDQQVAQQLNDLLADWHHYSRSYYGVHGYPSVDAACRLYRSSRQYDQENGALGAHAWASLMEAVDAIIDQIEQPARTALAFQARNFHTRAQVWSSPRLPSCPHERARLLVSARKMLWQRLVTANLV